MIADSFSDLQRMEMAERAAKEQAMQNSISRAVQAFQFSSQLRQQEKNLDLQKKQLQEARNDRLFSALLNYKWHKDDMDSVNSRFDKSEADRARERGEDRDFYLKLNQNQKQEADDKTSKIQNQALYNEIVQGIDTGKIKDVKTLQDFEQGQLPSDDWVRLTDYLGNAHDKRDKAYTVANNAAQTAQSKMDSQLKDLDGKVLQLKQKAAANNKDWNPFNNVKPEEISSAEQDVQSTMDKVRKSFMDNKYYQGLIDFDPATRKWFPLVDKPEPLNQETSGAAKGAAVEGQSNRDTVVPIGTNYYGPSSIKSKLDSDVDAAIQKGNYTNPNDKKYIAFRIAEGYLKKGLIRKSQPNLPTRGNPAPDTYPPLPSGDGGSTGSSYPFVPPIPQGY